MERFLHAFFNRLIKTGDVEIEMPDGHVYRVGDHTGPPLRVRFADRAGLWRMLRDPELAFGELYMDGRLTVERGAIYDVIELGLRNMARADLPRSVRALKSARVALRKFRQRNEPERAQKNVAHHYDLDDRLYGLFLDPDRQYSCAYHADPGATLEEAQLAKKRHIAAKLDLRPGQKVLDIGSGWGGLGLYLAQNCAANVIGVTLSTEQLAVSRRRATEEGLGERVDFRLSDYRSLNQRFDRIVSVGMFEHVGAAYYDGYFGKIAELLAEDGVALVHTIGSPSQPADTNPFIARYIFPGGNTPSMSEILPAIERAGLIVTDIEVLRLHYAETLRAWRLRFLAHWNEAKALYDERFCRMWEMYLAGSEACFRLGQLVNFQIQLTRKVDALPITRDYMAERERKLQAAERSRNPLRLAGE